MQELLTEAEHKAMALTADLWNLIGTEIVARGQSQTGDLRELADAIHTIQARILAQAAARAYPDRYRLLGSTLRLPEGAQTTGLLTVPRGTQVKGNR